MNDTRTVKLVCECEYITLDRRNLARPRKRWTNTLESEQAWNGVYLAAADDDNDTTFSYVTDRSVASTILSRCYATPVDTTNTSPAAKQHLRLQQQSAWLVTSYINTLNAELNPICHLLALLGVHHLLHVNRIRVKWMGPPTYSLSVYGSGILIRGPWQCCVVPSNCLYWQ